MRAANYVTVFSGRMDLHPPASAHLPRRWPFRLSAAKRLRPDRSGGGAASGGGAPLDALNYDTGVRAFATCANTSSKLMSPAFCGYRDRRAGTSPRNAAGGGVSNRRVCAPCGAMGWRRPGRTAAQSSRSATTRPSAHRRSCSAGMAARRTRTCRPIARMTSLGRKAKVRFLNTHIRGRDRRMEPRDGAQG